VMVNNFSAIFERWKMVIWIFLLRGTFFRKTYIYEKLTAGYMGRIGDEEE